MKKILLFIMLIIVLAVILTPVCEAKPSKISVRDPLSENLISAIDHYKISIPTWLVIFGNYYDSIKIHDPVALFVYENDTLKYKIINGVLEKP